jgi:uncharacterized protein
MSPSRRTRRLLLVFLLYVAFSAVAGIFLADGTLHPARRPLSGEEVAVVQDSLHAVGADLSDVSITVRDGTVLRGWIFRPQSANGNAAILLHGLADNRLGMVGYANFLLAHGFTVLLPDARAHGASGGELATYGLVERNDIHQWIDFLEAEAHPRCVFGLGESMGAAELLQSLDTHPKLCAVAAESPFANFREIAYDRMGQPFRAGPWLGRTLFRPIVETAFLRARWKYRLDMEQVSPEQSIANSDVPVLLIHGQIDGNIPVRHSRLIHTRDPGTLLWEVPHADHCGAFSVAPQEFEQRLLDWFSTRPLNGAKEKSAA